MAYRYENNVSPADRFDKLELQLDNGSTVVLQRGKSYDLTASELARASRFIVLTSTADPADADPVGIAMLPVVGTISNGQVPIWNSSLGAFVPGTVSTGGGGGTGGGLDSDALYGVGGTSLDIIEDPVTGWPARPVGGQAHNWIGWTDPTELMDEYDRFIPIPAPA